MLNSVQHLVHFFLLSADAPFIPVHRAGFSGAILIKRHNFRRTQWWVKLPGHRPWLPGKEISFILRHWPRLQGRVCGTRPGRWLGVEKIRIFRPRHASFSNASKLDEAGAKHKLPLPPHRKFLRLNKLQPIFAMGPS